MIRNIAYLLAIIFCLFQGKSFSQTTPKNAVRNAIYLEAFGIGGYGSINYERLLFNKNKSPSPKFNIGLRLGLSTLHIRDFEDNFNPDIIVPVSMNAFYGKTHHIEVGFGQTISNVVQANSTDFSVERKTTLNSNLTVGYRYQKDVRGMIFRLNYSPIISSNKIYNSWFGLSIGYGF